MTTETQRDRISTSRPLDRPWLPWGGAPSARDLVCWYGIWLVFAYSFAMWPLKPWLIGTNPLLLEVLTGTQSAMAVAGAFARVGEATMALALAAGVVGMMKFAWVFWWAGRLWGGNMVRLLSGVPDGRTKRSHRLFSRENPASRWAIGAAVVLAPLPLVPGPLAFAAAGWSGMGLGAFLVLNLIGSAAWTGLFTGLGYAMGQPAVDVAEAITDHAVWVSLGVIGATLVVQVAMGRRAAGGRS
ncbi:DedA family protein [Streptomyces sp. NPDC002187]|uniref:DedA family protein n=1 Tax=Streptomyces sp. NPDC002187 TaxID=3364637 RepID=UPI0036750B0C